MRHFALLGVLLVSTAAVGGDWSQFRGPNGSGVAEEKNLPTTWSKTDNVRWKAEIPGRSVCSPIVIGGRAYVASASGVHGDRLHVLCFDVKEGKQLWHRQLIATGNTGCHPKSSMAAPTPCGDESGVYVLFATADLAAFDKDGNLKWYRSLTTDYPKIANQVGMASSPILYKDWLIVPMDSDGESFLAAISTKDGKNVWKVDRPKDINWVTPTLRKVGDRTEVLFQTRTELVAYDVTNGKKAWSFASGDGGSVPSPLVVGDRIYVPGKGVTCLKPTADGKGVEEEWRSQKLASGSVTPLVYKDRIYSVNSAGALVCVEVKTGKDVWQERLKKGRYWASLIAGDDLIFACNDEGWCSVVRAGSATADVIGHIDFKDEIMGTPAIADGALFIQTVNGLYCIGAKK